MSFRAAIVLGALLMVGLLGGAMIVAAAVRDDTASRDRAERVARPEW